jgi:transcriptional regulator with XRE-family HTH domain
MIENMSNKPVSVSQIRAARGLLGWSQTALATAAGLSLPTVIRHETGNGSRVSDEAVAKLVSALEKAGIEFTNGSEPGLKLKKRRKAEG